MEPEKPSKKRTRVASSRLTNTDNVAEPVTADHRALANTAKTANPQGQTSESNSNPPPSTSTTTTTASKANARATNARKKTTVISVEDEEEDEEDDGNKGPAPKRPCPAPSTTNAGHEDDLDSFSGSEPEEIIVRQSLKDKSKDVNTFFDEQFMVLGRPRRACKLCSKNGPKVHFTSEISTLCRHMEFHHYRDYHKWATKNQFESKLTGDVKARKEAKATEQESQLTLDPHLSERPPLTKIIKYSDQAFKQAAIEWLAATNQPLDALNHPKFKEMIDIASRADNGVCIPTIKSTRQALINLFNRNLVALKKRLNGDKVGDVSLTCDGWQASNVDAYFAVTAHWIEETAPRVWKQCNALLGFSKMNTAHDGVRLGRALFRIVNRVGIAHKIGWITCDNATNNLAMLQHFARRLNKHPSHVGKALWDHKSRYIRCLAHVINLATQAVISALSKAKHYNPHSPEAHEPDVDAPERDEIGLVRAIAVKVRSSAKRKEHFLELQRSDKPLTMTLNMPARWSSTYAMLQRARDLKLVINDFLFQISRDEKDADKHQRLQRLGLSEEEWGHVDEVCRLLSLADLAQHGFSAEQHPTLQNGLPALEALFSAWKSRLAKDKYARYSIALQAGLDKIETYYDRTSTSHAYTFAMNPTQKMSHFDRHWGVTLCEQVRKDAEEIFKARYVELYGDKPRPIASSSTRYRSKNLGRLMKELMSDDEDKSCPSSTPTTAPSLTTTSSTTSGTPSTAAPDAGAASPWMEEFNQYLDSSKELEEHKQNLTLVEWWGTKTTLYPVWASLARDYLAIMASSVSSERAFSSAGLTITKRRNQLKADIVEALQFIKCAICTDLLFREEICSWEDDGNGNVVEDDKDPDWEDIEEKAWDQVLIDDSNAESSGSTFDWDLNNDLFT